MRGRQLKLTAHERARHAGCWVTTPARTWCDLATVLSDERLLAAGDRLIWWRDPLCSVDEIARVARRLAGGRGAARRARVLPMLSDRADSPPESVIRLRIVRAGLPSPAVNQRVLVGGQFIGMPDLSFPDFRMAIDYEGLHHLTDAKQWHKDLARVPRFENAGWHMTRASAPDLADSTTLIQNLRGRLLERGWNP